MPDAADAFAALEHGYVVVAGPLEHHGSTDAAEAAADDSNRASVRAHRADPTGAHRPDTIAHLVTDPKAATATTRDANAAAAAALPFEDRDDFADAERGLLARPDSLVIRDASDTVVWNMDNYGFLTADAAEAPPESVHPGLWRQARLNSLYGLFEVTDGVLQVRGYDISNMTLIEGERGVIVVDPLISTECAAAALALYRGERGDRPVVAVVYTHSHVDHFGGVKGVVDAEAVARGEVPVFAPEGFTEHAVSENVLAGTAMARRSAYMFGPRTGARPARAG